MERAICIELGRWLALHLKLSSTIHATISGCDSLLLHACLRLSFRHKRKVLPRVLASISRCLTTAADPCGHTALA